MASMGTAIILIATLTIANLFAFGVMSSGFLITRKVKDASQGGLGEAMGTLHIKGDVIASGDIARNAVNQIRFKMAGAPGTEGVNLTAQDTLLTYPDGNNRANIKHLDEATPGVDILWFHSWVVGSGDAVDLGDVVEFAVDVSALGAVENTRKRLGPNTSFRIEVLPVKGAVITVKRITPFSISNVMNLE